MISTKHLLGRGKQSAQVAIEPLEPLTIEGQQLASDVAGYLSRAFEEQRGLTAESDELGRQMAELLAAKELGQPVDPEAVITVAERRAVVKQQLEAVEFRIAGLQAQQDALRETENERRRVGLLPQLQKSSEMGEALIQQFYLQMCEVSETIEAIAANSGQFRSLQFDWDRVAQHVGHGVSAPREVWDFFPPEVKRQATYSNLDGRRTLAQQVDWTLYTGPAERRADFLRDHEHHAAQHAAMKRAEQQPYLDYLKKKRHAEREHYTIEPWNGPIPDGMKHLQSDLDWTGA